MKKFFQSKGFIVSSLAALCVVILGVCWFVSRDKPPEFKPDESPPSSTTSDWSDNGSMPGSDETNGADAYNPDQTADSKEEYPKVIEEEDKEVVIDFTPDSEKLQPEPPTPPEATGDLENPSEPPAYEPEQVAPPPTEAPAQDNTPAPGSSNGNGAIYDPVFGWVVPGDTQQSTGHSDGDMNKQVGNMG